MAKYSDIKGFTVQTLSTDTVASQIAGGTWASGGDLNTARRSGGGAGTQTAGLAFGGNIPPAVANTETYNGTSFTEVNDLNSARQDIAGCGTQTAALSVGGGPGDQALTELWNGSSWTEVNDLNTGRENVKSQSAGTSTASIMWGGYNPNGTGRAVNESWNGSSWTEVNDLNTGRYDSSGNGTSTAAIVVGGTDGSTLISGVEEWDGSSWTETTEANTNRTQGSASGTYQDLLYYSGGPPATGKTEFWNGSTWTEVNDMATSRFACTESRGATSSAVYAAGGRVPSVVATTEEFTAPAVFNKQVEGQLYFNSTTNTFKETVKDPTAGTWASSGGLNENRATCGGSGVQTAAIYFGGPEPSYGGKTETYNGSSFTEVADLNTGRVYGMPSGHGTTTATICFGGEDPIRALTESWDGSSWTEVGDLNLARYGGLGAGTATAAIAATGYATGQSPVMRTECELYNGSSWTEVNNNNTARYVGCGFGLQTTAVYAGGNVPPNNTSPAIESWDGTSWTEIAELNTARQQAGSAGATGTDGLVYGGRTGPSGPDVASTEYWNGSSWTEINDMATARGLIAQQQGMSPLASLAVNATPPSPTSEEFTSAGLSNKTITAS
jgi:hypothetical protein